MQFLNPVALVGLAAASIPLILHLLNLRKLRTVEFSTLRFLKELQKTKIKRLKLKQIILLILRTLIIIFAVLAFARPSVSGSLPLLGTYAKTSSAILIDNSFSMDVSDEYGNRLNQARNSAQKIINSMREGDEAALITMADTKSDKEYALTRNFNILRQELSGVRYSNNSASLENSLRLAASVLDESININKEVYIITDAQSNIFYRELNDSLKLFDNNTTVYFIPIGYKSGAQVQNLSIDSINVMTRIFQKDKLVDVEARVRNNSDKDATGVVVSMFFNGDRVAQRTLDVPKGEVKTITIAAEPKDYGITKASVEIEGDALEVDNKRFFGFIIPDKPNIALVGSPETRRFASIALGGRTLSDPPANVSEFGANDIGSINMPAYEIVIITGGEIRDADFQRLSQYVKNGGSVLIFAGDETPNDVLSRGLGSLGFGGITVRSFAQNQPAAFTTVDRIHPIFEGVFKGTTDNRAVVESPRIFKAYTANGGLSIIQMPGGAFLSESRLGEGRVIYCAVAPTSDWSSFPITGLFPTLIYRSVFYLSSREGLGANVRVGSTHMLTLPKRFAAADNFKISDPAGKEFFRKAAMLPGGSVITLDNLSQLGVYTVSTTDNKTAGVVSVNTDPTESRIEPLPEKEINADIASWLNKQAKYEFLDNPNNILKDVNRARTGTELWQLFTICAIILAFTEMLVAKNSKSEVEVNV